MISPLATEALTRVLRMANISSAEDFANEEYAGSLRDGIYAQIKGFVNGRKIGRDEMSVQNLNTGEVLAVVKYRDFAKLAKPERFGQMEMGI